MFSSPFYFTKEKMLTETHSMNVMTHQSNMVWSLKKAALTRL